GGAAPGRHAHPAHRPDLPAGRGLPGHARARSRHHPRQDRHHRLTRRPPRRPRSTTMRQIHKGTDGWETEPVTARGAASAFAGFRFSREVIAVAARWYLRYGLSYRDAEELP